MFQKDPSGSDGEKLGSEGEFRMTSKFLSSLETIKIRGKTEHLRIE